MAIIEAGALLPEERFRGVRRRAILEGGKWDPQVGDEASLAAFPLLMDPRAWNELAAWAERLSSELAAVEAELIERPELFAMLALPPRALRLFRRAVRAGDAVTHGAARTLRFDFHWAREGWRLSEVNSDVPGGYGEASTLTRLFAEAFRGTRSPGDPAARLAEAIERSAAPNTPIALVHAPGYMEDAQVTAYLARRIEERGRSAFLCVPGDLRWNDGLAATAAMGPVGAIFRFVQAEWLGGRDFGAGWSSFFFGGRTPVANPGIALLTESKRLPLVWDRLRSRVPTWRALLPETRDPRDAPWARDDRWLLKTAFCNTGDTVCVRELMTPKEWAKVCWAVRLRPGNWVAQRRFEPLALPSPRGPAHVCVGVYTVDGRCAGAYARLSRSAVVRYDAVDTALLLDESLSERKPA